MNLGCGTGHPSYVMSSSFANQTIAQIELYTQHRQVSGRRVRAAQAPGREGGAAAAEEAQRELTELTDAQARYIGVDKNGPYKADHYRY